MSKSEQVEKLYGHTAIMHERGMAGGWSDGSDGSTKALD
jgi:hypothetical protein